MCACVCVFLLFPTLSFLSFLHFPFLTLLLSMLPSLFPLSLSICYPSPSVSSPSFLHLTLTLSLSLPPSLPLPLTWCRERRWQTLWRQSCPVESAESVHSSVVLSSNSTLMTRTLRDRTLYCRVFFSRSLNGIVLDLA